VAGRFPPANRLNTGRLIGQKKAGVAEHLLVFIHAGLLVNGPPGCGLPFI
jgi:hypothetical protein